MGTEENLEVVRRLSAAMRSGDETAIRAELHPDVAVDDRDIIDAGDYRGADSVFRWQGQWDESWERWHVEDEQFLPAEGDRVLSLFRMVATGRGSGIELARRDAVLTTLRDGKVIELGYYNDQRKALEAAGLDPSLAQAD